MEIPADVSWEEARLYLFEEVRRLRSDLKAAHDKIRRLEDRDKEKRVRAGVKGGAIGTGITIAAQVIAYMVRVYTAK